MAIQDLFHCQVLVGNKALEEYDSGDDDKGHKHPIDQNIITKYIETDSGVDFAVRVVIEPGFNFEEADFLSVDIILDGDVKNCLIVEKEWYTEPEGKIYFVTSVGTEYKNGTKWFLRKFRFGDIKTDGGHDVSIIRVPGLGLSLIGFLQAGEIRASGTADTLKARYDELGSIKVEIWRIKTLSIGGDLSEAKSKPAGVILENELKEGALTLEASLGEPEVTEGRKVVCGEEIDVDPVTVFKFKYRSKEERPLEDLSIEEARELLRRQKAKAEATNIRIKKERAGTNLYTPRAVKRFREDMGIDEENEVEVIAERSSHKKQLPPAGQGVIDRSD